LYFRGYIRAELRQIETQHTKDVVYVRWLVVAYREGQHNLTVAS
jgi:hypothetical protein